MWIFKAVLLMCTIGDTTIPKIEYTEAAGDKISLRFFVSSVTERHLNECEQITFTTTEFQIKESK
jgi:hypothetical protein